jgi:4-diphosphocytidyl-2-C-methyl-D-erythritol kinase
LIATIACHAKANLLLRVLARHDDGFHSLETVFCLLGLADELTAERRAGSEVTLDTGGVDLGPAHKNLAVRAALAVLNATSRTFGVHLTLTKRIPVQAGLGGGSSNAAGALTLVNHLAGNAIPRHELLQIAAHLGSDVPYFVSGGALALGWNRGERMLRLAAPPSAPVLILLPPVGVSTTDAYRWVDEARLTGASRGAVALDLDGLGRWGSLARMAGNEFESVVFGRRPEVRTAFEAMTGTHPLLCRMSGSGSAIVAVYRTVRERDDARMMLNPRLGRTFATDTLAHDPPGVVGVDPPG